MVKRRLFPGATHYLSKRSKPLLITSGIFLLLLIAVADYLTGAELNISIFYLLPISIMVWFVNKRVGGSISVLSAAAGLTTDLMTGHAYSHPIIVYWNRAVELGFFLIIVVITEALRRSHSQLEIRVKDRTVELTKANEILRDEIAERKRAEESLKNSEERLKHLSSNLLKCQEEERKRISLELHDSVTASLSAIKVKIEGTVKQMEDGLKMPGSIRVLIPAVQSAIEESRRIIAALRPSILDDLGLIPAVGWLCRQFQEFYSNISIENRIEISEEDVPAALKIVIFRILQEALNNVAKHSKADLVHLSLTKSEGQIELRVQDNGQGFHLLGAAARDSFRKGLGLTSMRERAELSGGSFLIESEGGKGTVIIVFWPLVQKSRYNAI